MTRASFTDLDFLVALDLLVEPFVALGVAPLPPWVAACHALAARDAADVLTLKASTTEGRAAREEWRRFLVLLTRDDVSRDAIDAVGRLGDREAAADFVAPMLATFRARMAAAPLSARLAALHALRTRRLDGRAARAPDAVYEAETGAPWAATKNRPPRP